MLSNLLGGRIVGARTRLVRGQANCGTRQRGHIGIGQVGFAMPVASQGPQLFHGRPLDDQSIMIGRSETLDLCSPNGYGLIAVVVDAELLRSVWERMYQKPLSDWLGRQLDVKVRPGMAKEGFNHQVRGWPGGGVGKAGAAHAGRGGVEKIHALVDGNGKSNRNVAPFSPLCATMLPPCRSRMRFVIAKPSPAPPTAPSRPPCAR